MIWDSHMLFRELGSLSLLKTTCRGDLPDEAVTTSLKSKSGGVPMTHTPRTRQL